MERQIIVYHTYICVENDLHCQDRRVQGSQNKTIALLSNCLLAVAKTNRSSNLKTN